jgi:hypothetical protein
MLKLRNYPAEDPEDVIEKQKDNKEYFGEIQQKYSGKKIGAEGNGPVKRIAEISSCNAYQANSR